MQLPQLTAWLSWAGATDTGTLSVPDLMGGSPATQSNGALKPTISTTANGIQVGTFSSSVLFLPLSAAINGNTQFGIEFWIKLANISGTKTVATIRNVAGGASADKLALFIIGGVLQTRALAVDRRAQAGGLDTNWRHCYVGIDCGQANEPTQVLLALDGVLQSAFFSSDTAWPATLGTPTGNMYVGANDAAASGPLVADISDIRFYSGQLSAAEISLLMGFRRPLLLPLTGNIVCLGNSITAGDGLSVGQDYPSVLRTSLGATWQVFNCGHSGYTTPQLLAGFAEVQSHRAWQTSNNVLVVNEVGNDIILGGASEATARENMRALIAQGRASGWRVLFATTTPRTAGGQVECANINTYFRTHPSEHDGLVDWAADSHLSDPTNTTYYQDGVHPTAAGAVILASLTAAAL